MFSGAFSPLHVLLIIIVIAVLFGGRGKLSAIMGDAAKGIKAFKDGLKEDDKVEHKPAGAIAQKDAEKDEARP